MKSILGLDVGTTSIGFALISLDEDKETGCIVHSGCRVFPEGVTEDKKESRNKARREARLRRRQLRRKKENRKRLAQFLHETSLLPVFGSTEWKNLMDNTHSNPYELRSAALKKQLQPFELGKVIYHLAKHRGFKATKLDELMAESDEKKELGVVKDGIKELDHKLGDQTLGVYLASIPPSEKKRGRYLGRYMIQEELEQILEYQKHYNPELITSTFKKHLNSLIFSQRPTFWRLNTLGTCSLEQNESVCPKHSWIGQQFIMMQKVNDLRIVEPHPRHLTMEERTQLIQGLCKQKIMSFGGIRKLLHLPKGTVFNFETYQDKEDKRGLPGNAIEAALSTIFGSEWKHLPHKDAIRSSLSNRIWSISYNRVGNKRIEIRADESYQNQRQTVKQEMMKDWNIAEDQAEQLVQLPIPPQWLRFSEKAIQKLLPDLESGVPLQTAIKEHYPETLKSSEVEHELLPSSPHLVPELRNPTVNRALNELRKVVNNIIRSYGKPDIIRIELARDLKLGKKKKLEITKKNRQREQERKEAKNQLEKEGVKPTGMNIEKFLLWQESDGLDLYTGQKISFAALFKQTEYDIEHIIPRSRSFNNTFFNKTLAHNEINRQKGNMIPKEFFGDGETWHAFVTRVNQSKLPLEKKEKLLIPHYDAIASEEMTERQLRDTAYIATEAKTYLQTLGIPVQPTNGRATASLRRVWGINSIWATEFGLEEESKKAAGEKIRDDHRHHAVDAAVVALTSPGRIKRLSTFYQYRKEMKPDDFPLPWETFRADLITSLHKIIISHRVQRKISGPLHEETAYGFTKKKSETDPTAYYFVTRKTLDKDFKPNKVKDIVDPAVRHLIGEHLQKFDNNPAVAFAPENRPHMPLRKGGWGPPIKKVRIQIARNPQFMVSRQKNPISYYDSGDNHHMAIYGTHLDDGTVDPETVSFEVVSRFEVNQRASKNEPLVKPQNENGVPLLFTLVKNNVLIWNEPGEEEQMHLVRWTTANKGRIFHKPLWMSGTPPIEISISVKNLISYGGRKVSVDPIGNIFPCND